MPKETILSVDDEPGIRQLVRLFLERYHYDVIESKNGAEGLKALEMQKVDLIVLDLMLPDIYGMDMCKKVRETSNVPIIMLTAVHGEMNVVLGFEAGADDYVEKPFSPQVLLSRIQAILKRHKSKMLLHNEESVNNTGAYSAAKSGNKVTYSKATFGQWTYFREDCCIKHFSGKIIFLTKNEALLTELFLANEQEVLSRDKIAVALKLDLDAPESRAIDVQISRLRNKLRDKSTNNLIKSIRNKGYLLSVPVRLS